MTETPTRNEADLTHGHTLTFDPLSDAGRAIGELYAGVQQAAAAHGGKWDTDDVSELLGQWFDALGFDLRLPSMASVFELDREGEPIGDVLLLPESYRGDLVPADAPAQRLACRYCGGTSIERLVDIGARFATRRFEIGDDGLLALISDAAPKYDDEAVNERLNCAGSGHELTWPDWLGRDDYVTKP